MCDKHSQAFTDMLAALEELMGCPYGIDYASVPQAGIESAPPYQVVGSMSVALTRYMQARAAIEKARKEMGE